jgi:UDP-glucose 4-epimerase
MADASPLVVVTGGAGFIGTHLARELLARGFRVRAFDNLYRPVQRALDELGRSNRFELVEGDVRYRDSLARGLVGADLLVHLAALSINKSVVDQTESLEVNLLGSQRTFEAAMDAGVRRVVFGSSASVYGEPTRLPMGEDDPLRPATPYCLSKLAAEHLLQFYGRQRGLSWMALRYFNVYGPDQKTQAYYTSVVLTFIRRLLTGEPPVIQGSGDQGMDFVHVADVARATADALTSEEGNHVINIGSGEATTIADLARMLIEIVGLDVEPVFEPRDTYVSRRQADIGRAEKVLGWAPQVPLRQGLEELVDLVRANG